MESASKQEKTKSFTGPSGSRDGIDPLEQERLDWQDCAKSLNSTFLKGSDSKDQLESIFDTGVELSSFLSAQGNDEAHASAANASAVGDDLLIGLETPPPFNDEMVNISSLNFRLSDCKIIISHFLCRADSSPPRLEAIQWTSITLE